MGSGACALNAARDALRLPTKITGVASEAAPAIAFSFAARRVVVHVASTRIADGVACSTPDPAALAYLLAGLERIVCVTDDETEAAIRACFSDTHNVAEGAGAGALAAVLRERETYRDRRVGVMLTGGNIDAAAFARVLAAG